MDGLTQEGLTYSGFTNGGASNSDWRRSAGNDEGPSGYRESAEPGLAEQRAQRAAQLARTIEAEIIPRLMLAHRAAATGVIAPGAASSSRAMEQVVEFCDLVLNHELRDALAFVDEMMALECPLEAIYLELLGPTARRLGEMWESDLCSFADVTIGLGRLQQVLHEISPAFREGHAEATGLRALLVPAPGEQHTLGLLIVSEFFRRAGWEVWSELPPSRNALFDLVRAEWFDVVGLSAGSDCRLDLLKVAIADIRRASLNPAISVMVGGPVFLARPEFVAQVGADGMAADARQAVLKAGDFMARKEPR